MRRRPRSRTCSTPCSTGFSPRTPKRILWRRTKPGENNMRVALVVAATFFSAAAAASTGVDGARIIAADKEPGNWLSYGRTYDEQRFSPLDKVNAGNVDKLGLAWTYKLDVDRGVEA